MLLDFMATKIQNSLREYMVEYIGNTTMVWNNIIESLTQSYSGSEQVEIPQFTS